MHSCRVQSLKLSFARMARCLHSIARLGAFAALLLMPTLSSAAWGEGKECFKSWDEARDAIQENGLVSGKQITKLAGDPANVPPESSFLEAYLCKESAGFVYRLYYVDKSGQVVIKTVDAREPFPAP